MSRRSITVFAAISTAMLCAGEASAQFRGPRSVDSQAVRGQAKRILDRPEFRHFRRLKIQPSSTQFQPRNFDGSPAEGDGQAGQGQGGNGQGNVGDGQGGRFRDGQGDFGRGDGRDNRGQGNNGGRLDRGVDDRDAGAARPNEFINDFPDESQPDTRDTSPVRDSAGSGAFSSAVGGIMHVLAWVVLAAVVGLIVFLIVRAIANFERTQKLDSSLTAGDASGLDGDLEPEQAPGQLPADVYIDRARELAAAGRFREAVAQLLLGAMSRIERAGKIVYRRGLTCRDYVRAVRADAPVHKTMKAMVKTYEPLGFGRREAVAAHFRHALSAYEAGFRRTVAAE